MRTHLNRPLLGIAYLAVIAMLMSYCIGSFRQSLPWQHRSTVVIRAKHAGLQLSRHADVKLQGVTVGEVRSIESNGREATINLAITSDRLAQIPGNVLVQITPKTLFGAKYVSLGMPTKPSGHLSNGSVITQSQTAVELDELFNDLVPLLRALDPAQLSVTLNAISQALHGRGKELGTTLAKLNTYLGKLNPTVPALVQDITRLSDVADVYSGAAPDIISILDNARATTQELLVPHENSLANLLKSTIRAVDVTDNTLESNGPKIVTLVGQAEPLERVLADYASEFPCVIHGLTQLDELTGKAYADGPYMRVSIDVITHHEAYKYPADLPSGASSEANNANLPAGVDTWAPFCPTETAQMRRSLTPAHISSDSTHSSAEARKIVRSLTSLTSPTDRLARSVAAEALGVDSSAVPSIAVLLGKPLLTNGEVTLR